MKILTSDEARAAVAGKRVAIVGNAASVLEGRAGEEIDGHDVVVRLNAGMPGVEHVPAIGRRTTILAVGTLVALDVSLAAMPLDVSLAAMPLGLLDVILAGLPIGMLRLAYAPSFVWWIKPTRMGTREWGVLAKGGYRPMRGRETPIWRIPPEDIWALGRVIGSPPSGGAAVIDQVLKGSPASVDLYGFDHFAGPTWWKAERPEAVVDMRGRRPNDHDGTKERAWLTGLGLARG